MIMACMDHSHFARLKLDKRVLCARRCAGFLRFALSDNT
jgi:hypothetical protein